MIEETLCPKCNSKMISRKNKNSGQRFWGCSQYPKCNGTRDTDGRSPEQRDPFSLNQWNNENENEETKLPSERFFRRNIK